MERNSAHRRSIFHSEPTKFFSEALILSLGSDCYRSFGELISVPAESRSWGYARLMDNHFQKLQDSKDLQKLLARSEEKAVVIFKHSTTCPISAGAYEEMSRVVGEVALVDVQSARDVSGEIATITAVEHQSPQVIILRNGKPVWHKSHWSITKEAVEKALSENA